LPRLLPAETVPVKLFALERMTVPFEVPNEMLDATGDGVGDRFGEGTVGMERVMALR